MSDVAGGAMDGAMADRPLTVVAVGAHPDPFDMPYQAGGTLAKYAARDHNVVIVSAAYEDEWAEEVRKIAARLGATQEWLDFEEGAIFDDPPHTHRIIDLLRRHRADVVITHQPTDYHPDHRAVGQLIQDASYMVTVPFFCPDTPPLPRNPVFLSYEDNFTRPNPFTADIVVAIDDVLDKKLAAMEALPSQFYEGGANGGPALVPDDEAGKTRRRNDVRESFRRQFNSTATRYRARLRELYGAQRGDAAQAAEAFEISEYGRRPSAEEIKKLFPFF